MTLEDIKLFLRIDQDEKEEDYLLESFKISAEEYLTVSGVKKDYSKELYKLAVKLLIVHWYENRESIGARTMKVAFSLDNIIMNLKYMK